MPMEQALKCSECGSITRYRDAKYIENTLRLNHKPDCSQRTLAYPALYITYQAIDPSSET